MKKYLLFFLFFFFFGATPVVAQEPSPQQQQTFEAVITQVTEEKNITVNGKKQKYQKLEAEITSGEREGEKITLENGTVPMLVIQDYATDDQVVVTAFHSPDGKELFSITDYVRRTPLLLLFGIFVGLVILVGRKRGIASLGGMFFSFVVIFTFVLPQILAGQNPVLTVIIASLAIIPLTFYFSHGLNRKTTSAVLGTIIALLITGVLATIFINAARFTGFASDEANFLQAARPDVINMQGLLLAGILIGILGILDDITISQAAIVQQLKKASPNLKFHQLFLRTMDVGKDHIASTVNTLILVYTGAALPLLLLFLDNPQPIASVVNYEMIAEEIVRMLLASIGLILAVPFTTAIAAWMIKK